MEAFVASLPSERLRYIENENKVGLKCLQKYTAFFFFFVTHVSLGELTQEGQCSVCKALDIARFTALSP